MIADLGSEVEEKGSEELLIASMACGRSWIVECPDSMEYRLRIVTCHT